VRLAAQQTACLDSRIYTGRQLYFSLIGLLFTPCTLLCTEPILSFVCVVFTDSTTEKRFTKLRTTLSNGYLGSRNDEERSEMRYVMRIAEFSESSNL
jgi:hypothetical protein